MGWLVGDVEMTARAGAFTGQRQAAQGRTQHTACAAVRRRFDWRRLRALTLIQPRAELT